MSVESDNKGRSIGYVYGKNGALSLIAKLGRRGLVGQHDIPPLATLVFRVKETFENEPPTIELLTLETFENEPPTTVLKTLETFENEPPAMSLLTLEDFDGFSVNENLAFASNESGFNIDVEQDVTGAGGWQLMFSTTSLGDVSSLLFYPARQHRAIAPATHNGKNIDPPGSNVQTFTPAYGSKTTITFTYT